MAGSGSVGRGSRLSRTAGLGDFASLLRDGAGVRAMARRAAMTVAWMVARSLLTPGSVSSLGLAVNEPVKNFHGTALKGCDECADFLGRSADISMGSVGSIAGWTSAIIRTARGLAAFERARSKLDIRTMDDPDALVRLDNLDKRIAFRSLERTFDPDAPLFVDYEDHVRDYAGTDRRAVVTNR